MTRLSLKALSCALLLLGADAIATQALAQTASGDGLTLRQRLDDRRDDARRTPGERSLNRSNSALETRRRQILRQRNSAVGTQRSQPILPRTKGSSVVVTQ